MPKKRAKQGKKVPFPHVCTKNVCFVHCDMEFDTIRRVTEAIEDVYPGYPIRLVDNEADLELL